MQKMTGDGFDSAFVIGFKRLNAPNWSPEMEQGQ